MSSGGIMGSHETPSKGCWELKSDPLEEQLAFSTTELSLLKFFLIYTVLKYLETVLRFF